jgi:flagellar hook-basal body complex protein FliE
MNIGGIDSSRIEAMMAQLKAAATNPAASPLGGAVSAPGVAPEAKLSFGDALKGALDQVNNAQVQAGEMSKRFASGDDTVSLSDTMIAMQKAGIQFQATVQVRNKLVSAYHDIMSMQV